MADTISATIPNEIAALVPSLEGAQNTRYLALATFIAYSYDYFLTVDEEIEYFWKGDWDLTKILFITNRYFAPIVIILGLISLFAPGLSFELWVDCTGAIPATYILNIIGICIVQGIIVLRIWYIFSSRRTLRLLVVVAYVGCTVATAVVFASLWHQFAAIHIDIPGYNFLGCGAPPATDAWRMFLPNLIIHTILFIGTTIPALKPNGDGRRSPLMLRLIRDGGTFYIVVFIVALVSTIGALQHHHLEIMFPAIYSNALLGLISIATSHLMLSIRSLAANLSIDPNWLLNNAELSRVQWRKGAHDGELIVEIGPREEDEVELSDVTEKRGPTPTLYTSRVGTYDDLVPPKITFSTAGVSKGDLRV
ncbi:hypothetical protein SCP_0101820 [Sparassis crispa]|uniref:DUF6533 domain-containing protein n=1 Tax=Sparassis crispa TaxID=139825 RepID=A0A401G580_9APHY|nr:hypothetical protein SCP_0101820 [Sparassis crispa]GBE77309.1 hypothetical protein SCP_0101820 [Sparassis crispa]